MAIAQASPESDLETEVPASRLVYEALQTASRIMAQNKDVEVTLDIKFDKDSGKVTDISFKVSYKSGYNN